MFRHLFPLQAPTKCELVVNLKTAKILGLDLPAAGAFFACAPPRERRSPFHGPPAPRKWAALHATEVIQ
jgi:hypothetical protein